MKIKKNMLEWTVFGAGLILVAGLLGILVNQAMRTEGREPKLEIVFSAPATSDGLTRYTMTVSNSGNATAKEVHVVVGLAGAGGTIERGYTTFDFVPRRSKRTAELAFRDAGPGSPVVISVAFQKE